MTHDPQFGLQSHLDHLYEHGPQKLAFNAKDQAEFALWQTALRQEVKRLLGIDGRVLPDNPATTPVHKIDRDGYVEEKFALDVGEGVQAPIYVLTPNHAPPYKLVMVFHGHNPNVQYVLGNYPDEETAREKKAIDNNYAQALAQAGYLVCAVEQRGFGERTTAQDNDKDYINSCRHLSMEYMLQGRALLGERVWDGMNALTAMLQRDDLLPGAGVTGNSGGGTTALWLAALEERLTVAVPASYFCSFKASILGMRHCECNYVPGILEFAEMGDLAALIAPRPVCFIAGEQDPIFPVEATREQFKTVQAAYALFDAQDRCALKEHPGGHAYNHALSHAWFNAWL